MQSFDEALSRLLNSAECIVGQERVSVNAAFNRVLAENIVAPIAVPAFDNSAMDGIAFAFDDVCVSERLPITQTVFAGHAPKALKAGDVCRIFTGAPLPVGADTVVLQEDCEFISATEPDLGLVKIVDNAIRKGQHVRQKGEDIGQGDEVLYKSTRLSAAQIGLLASLGVVKVAVFKPLKVAVVSTGDELRNAGDDLGIGEIYNSNGPMLCAALQGLGVDVQAFHVEDELAATKAVFAEAAAKFDMIISVGGVSVGEADFVKQAIEEQGQIEFWKVAMKPGKPLAFGHVTGIPLIGLPGNPVSAFASFQLFALPFLRICQGEEVKLASEQKLPIILAASITPQRETFLRVSRVLKEGQYYLKPYPSQGSGVLSSVAFSEGFARVPRLKQTCSGDLLTFIPFF